MTPAQDLHDKLKALAEEFRGTPGLSYHLSQLEGLTGHLRQTIKQQAREAAVAAPDPEVADVVAAPSADSVPGAPAPTPAAPAVRAEDGQHASAPAKPAPVVQVAKPATPGR